MNRTIRPMTPADASALVGIEYDCVVADAALQDLAGHLSRSRLPEVAAEAAVLRKLAACLRRVLRRIDPHVSDAVAVIESSSPPPF